MTRFLIVAITIALAACSGASGPIIDTKGVDMTQYAQDKAECESYAQQVSTSSAAAKGAAGGAIVGAAIGAIGGNAGRAAGVGAITGGAASANNASGEKTRVVNNCLRGRGYRVLN